MLNLLSYRGIITQNPINKWSKCQRRDQNVCFHGELVLNQYTNSSFEGSHSTIFKGVKALKIAPLGAKLCFKSRTFPKVIKNSMPESAEHEIFLLINVKMPTNCWHFHIYEQ